MKRIFRVLIALWLTLLPIPVALMAQGPTWTTRPVYILNDAPTITIAGATADTTATPTVGMHEVSMQWKFGTVAGSYTTCTVQAKTSIDNGVTYLLLGSAVSVTVTSGTTNVWRLVEASSGSVSTTTSPSFGQQTKYTFACSGGYGTSAPVTVSATYYPTDPSQAGGGGGGTVQIQASNGDNLTDTANALDINIKSDSVGVSTATNQTTEISTLTTIQTDVAPLVNATTGGYVRQDAGATIAKETGGNLATVATNSTTETARTADYDTGAGTATTVMLGIALPASGGPVAGGTTTNPISVDVHTITAAATGQQTGANSDSVGCASDIHCVIVGTGTAGSPAGNLLTVQGVASMTPIIIQGIAGGVAAPMTISPAYNAIPVVLTNTQAGGFQLSPSQFLKVIQPIETPFTNSALQGVPVTAVNTSATVLDAISCFNSDTTNNAFVTVYNATGGSTQTGTTPAVYRYMAPFGLGFTVENIRTAFSNGITLTATTTATGNTNAVTALVCNVRSFIQ